MIASAIGVTVLLVVVSAFMTAQSMLKTAMAESELSLALREMRDKLLFKVSPDIGGQHYAGLLSGRQLNENGETLRHAVEMAGRKVGSSLSSASDASLRLLVWQQGMKKMLINEHTPDKDAHARWLWPGALALVRRDDQEKKWKDATSMSDVLNYSSRNPDGSNVYQLDFDIALAADVCRRDGSRIVRKERVSVPILGKLQPLKDTE